MSQILTRLLTCVATLSHIYLASSMFSRIHVTNNFVLPSCLRFWPGFLPVWPHCLTFTWPFQCLAASTWPVTFVLPSCLRFWLGFLPVWPHCLTFTWPLQCLAVSMWPATLFFHLVCLRFWPGFLPVWPHCLLPAGPPDVPDLQCQRVGAVRGHHHLHPQPRASRALRGRRQRCQQSQGGRQGRGRWARRGENMGESPAGGDDAERRWAEKSGHHSGLYRWVLSFGLVSKKA